MRNTPCVSVYVCSQGLDANALLRIGTLLERLLNVRVRTTYWVVEADDGIVVRKYTSPKGYPVCEGRYEVRLHPLLRRVVPILDERTYWACVAQSRCTCPEAGREAKRLRVACKHVLLCVAMLHPLYASRVRALLWRC